MFFKKMIDPKQIMSIFFDFDGTLCSGRYFDPLGTNSLHTIGQLVFGGNSAQWADPWMKGYLSSRDIAAYLSTQLQETEEQILSSLQDGCSNMRFNAAVYDFAMLSRQSGRKTALVTGNMDVFTEVVVPAHGLDRMLDLVLNTSDHRTLDKSILWRKAFNTFGSKYSFSSALLIDDSPRMIALVRSLGGIAYQYP
ncbi:MAG: haloacid dehalogenase-like hydrolase [Syntrophaceae bacterium]|nr:haloacid dehalogenase-like hydrolase [Syntrophaceae bacterium]